jgi:hypothetical protein
MTVADASAGTIYGTAGNNQAGFGRAQMCPRMTYANIATAGGIEQRLAAPVAVPAIWTAARFVHRRPSETERTSVIRELGPGQSNWDISLLKTTKILENHTVQFRAEFFDACNHPQFTNPNYGIGAIYSLPNVRWAAFGQITSTSVNPRVIQFALKYSF